MTTSIKRTPLAWAGAAIAILASVLMLTVAQAAMAKKFEGDVVSKNAAEQTFRLDREHAGIVRIAVDGSTIYQRLSGFGEITKGMARGHRPALERALARLQGRKEALTKTRH